MGIERRLSATAPPRGERAGRTRRGGPRNGEKEKEKREGKKKGGGREKKRPRRRAAAEGLRCCLRQPRGAGGSPHPPNPDPKKAFFSHSSPAAPWENVPAVRASGRLRGLHRQHSGPRAGAAHSAQGPFGPSCGASCGNSPKPSASSVPWQPRRPPAARDAPHGAQPAGQGAAPPLCSALRGHIGSAEQSAGLPGSGQMGTAAESPAVGRGGPEHLLMGQAESPGLCLQESSADGYLKGGLGSAGCRPMPGQGAAGTEWNTERSVWT